MLTCLNSAPTARSAATVCAEKPHCGKSGVPFMNSTTGLEESSALILSTTSICTLPLQFPPLPELLEQTPLLRSAHVQPTSDLFPGAEAPDAEPAVIEGADVDARRWGALLGLERELAQSALNYGGASPILQTLEGPPGPRKQ